MTMPRKDAHGTANPHARDVRDTASMTWRSILVGAGVFDVGGEHPNKKGWEIFELGQRSFWAVPTAIDWEEPVREDPEYAEPIAAMLAFLCPGEKTAVTGASLVSTMVKSEEAKFYFAEQALEEAKHFDALRRIIPKITGRPMEPPNAWVRLLYGIGVVDRDDPAFMMGNINIVGEHLAHQIFHQINHVAKDPNVRKLLALIGKDESRHIAAGQRFYGEVFDHFKKNRRKIMAKNFATAVVLNFAGYDLVNPMRALKIDLAEILDATFAHYQEVTDGLPVFPDKGMLHGLMDFLRRRTPHTIATIARFTDGNGNVDTGRFVAACEEAMRSPRALRTLFAA